MLPDAAAAVRKTATQAFQRCDRAIKAMHELNRDDPRAKEILRGLLVTWHQKNRMRSRMRQKEVID